MFKNSIREGKLQQISSHFVYDCVELNGSFVEV